MSIRPPTSAEMREKVRADRKQAKQEAFERRWKARQLIFGKSGGNQKKLTFSENAFVRRVKHEAYLNYLQEFSTGKSQWGVGKTWNRRLRRKWATKPQSYGKWIRKWYGSQKARWIHFDVPRMMRMKLEAFRDGRHSAVRELGEGELPELRNEAGERNGRGLGVPVPEPPVQVHSSRQQGRRARTVEIRERKKAAGRGSAQTETH